MQIIKKAEAGIARLWGVQKPESGPYRLMKYLIRETVEGKELLCNNITGELVLLSEEESALLRSEPVEYSPPLRELVEHRFLVPPEFSEYDSVLSLRKILRMLAPKPKHIVNYTILPTTACNARCYYCFEKGSKIVTMTEQTADQTVEFIKQNCGGNKVKLDWFGGEPTVAHKRISQICSGLTAAGIDFTSSMITNGYLFDEELVNEAVDVWKMDFVRFSFDGSRENYNKIKNFVNPVGDPYERVTSAVGFFLKRKVDVGVRMNFDLDTADDFQNLLEDVYSRYGTDEHLTVFSYAVHGEYADSDGVLRHGDDEWLTDTELRLNDYSAERGLYKSETEDPCMAASGCMASDSGCITITPEGNLVRCPSQYDSVYSVGTVYDGITDEEKYKAWEASVYPGLCIDCAFLPLCDKRPDCPGNIDCYQRCRNRRIVQKQIKLTEGITNGKQRENEKA